MNPLFKRMRELAEKATRGEWSADHDDWDPSYEDYLPIEGFSANGRAVLEVIGQEELERERDRLVKEYMGDYWEGVGINVTASCTAAGYHSGFDTAVSLLMPELERYREALEGLKLGDCFCEVAIGNPMMRDHTSDCKRARAALNGEGGEPARKALKGKTNE